MRVLTGFVFLLNIALWICGAVIGFISEGGILGFPIIIGIIGFFIAWHLSGGIVTSPADYFFQPEWDVFKTKLKWSNSTAGIVGLIAYIIIGILFI